MRVICTGSRDFAGWGFISDTMDDLYRKLAPGDLLYVLVGDCRTGADFWVRRWASNRGGAGRAWRVAFEVFAAEWDVSGRAAGPLRNQRMVDAGADLLVAFLAPPPALNRGTLGCLALAEAAGIEVVRYGWIAEEKDEQETLPI